MTKSAMIVNYRQKSAIKFLMKILVMTNPEKYFLILFDDKNGSIESILRKAGEMINRATMINLLKHWSMCAKNTN